MRGADMSGPKDQVGLRSAQIDQFRGLGCRGAAAKNHDPRVVVVLRGQRKHDRTAIIRLAPYLVVATPTAHCWFVGSKSEEVGVGPE